MANNRIVFEGLEELKRQLRQLPAELTVEAQRITEAAANGAAASIRAAYPRRSGALINGVRVTHYERGKFSAGAILKNSAPHAAIFEVGTQARHNALGANRGSMPPGHVFVPIAIQKRRQMYIALADLLRRHGLSVSGEASGAIA